jgi:hypothetical protein
MPEPQADPTPSPEAPSPEAIAIIALRAGLSKALANHRDDVDSAAAAASRMRLGFPRDHAPALEPALVAVPPLPGVRA